jgi:hypothetical protein
MKPGRIYIELVNQPFLMRAQRPANSAPRWRARLNWAGSGVTTAARL